MSEDRTTIDKVQLELDGWRTRFDELKVRGALTKMEARERYDEWRDKFESEYESATARLKAIQCRAGDEIDALRTSVERGWQEMRRAYRDHFDGIEEQSRS